MNEMLFEYDGDTYPDFLRRGNAMQFFVPFARHFCRGIGLDVGCGDWPLEGATGIDMKHGGDAMNLPEGEFDFVASSHCLEHVVNPVAAIEHWKTRIRPGGVLALYLPHPDQKYWRPSKNRKHLHMFYPDDTAQMLRDLGFVDVIHSERDMAWSFAVVGFTPKETA
jgi:SAM-dependent methyltransferase